MSEVTVHHGDSREVLKGLADASIDSVVCDPPYALVSIGKRFGADGAAPAKSGKSGVYARASAGFMGQKWDTGETAFAVEFWAEVYRVLKPGAHVIAFSGTRTYHRLACAIEDAGFEIRDMVAWLYGSGFPKSHDVSKGIDKRRDWSLVERLAGEIKRARAEAGLSLKQMGEVMQGATSGQYGAWYHRGGHMFFETGRSLPSRPEWQYLRESLPIRPEFLAVYDEAEREVLSLQTRMNAPSGIVGAGREGVKIERRITAPATEASRQWEGWGTALKPALEPIVLARKPLAGTVAANVLAHGTGALNIDGCRVGNDERVNGPASPTSMQRKSRVDAGYRHDDGIGPGAGPSVVLGRWPANVVHDGSRDVVEAFPAEAGAFAAVRGTEPSNAIVNVYGDRTRVATHHHGDSGSAARFFYTAKADAEDRLGSKHPTVKPVDLMAWLCRLVTPPGGLILDPFAGTGTTGLAAMREGFDCILIEREAQYVADIERRLAWARGEGRLTAQETSRVEQKTVEGLALFGDAA